MKQYITYKRKHINDSFYADPNTNNWVHEATEGAIELIETLYQVDWVFISYIDFDGRMSDRQMEFFRTLDPAFEFTFAEEWEINTLLSTLWDVFVKDFIFTDNRPVDLL